MNKKEKFTKKISHSYDALYANEQKSKVNKISNKIFNDVRVNNLNNLSGLDKRGSLVFLSNHQSMSDFILIANVFIKHNLDLPRFLGGDNLYVRYLTRSPSLLPDLKKMGMINIDRTRFGDEPENYVYKKSFVEYMINFFGKNENLVFFPEGGRSYDGKLKKFEDGMFKLINRYCNKDSFLVPIFCGYDLVVDAVGFENNSSTKDSNTSKVKRFLTDFNLFRKHYKSNNFLNNDAEFNVGIPINIKGRSLDELMSYTRDSFLDLTKVSCAEISSYAFNNLKNGEVKTRDLVNETERLLSLTPVENMNSKLLSFRNDAEKVLDTGITNINSQNPSIVTSLSKMNVVNEFLVNYYSNSVSDFFNYLNNK